MSRRKDQERFDRLKQQNPDYVGFRGAGTVTPKPQVALESATCSVCNRKRNVPSDSLPEDRDSYVCASCQGSEAAATPN
jgi:hypothetical protein